MDDEMLSALYETIDTRTTGDDVRLYFEGWLCDGIPRKYVEPEQVMELIKCLRVAMNQDVNLQAAAKALVVEYQCQMKILADNEGIYLGLSYLEGDD